MLAARETLRLADLVRRFQSSPDENGPIVDSLLKRASRIPATDEGLQRQAGSDACGSRPPARWR